MAKVLKELFVYILLVLCICQTSFCDFSFGIECGSKKKAIIRLVYKLASDTIWTGKRYVDFHLKEGEQGFFLVKNRPDTLERFRFLFLSESINTIEINRVFVARGEDTIKFTPDELIGEFRWANYLDLSFNSGAIEIDTKISPMGRDCSTVFIDGNSLKRLAFMYDSTKYFQNKLFIRLRNNENFLLRINYGPDKNHLSDRTGKIINASQIFKQHEIDFLSVYRVRSFSIHIYPKTLTKAEIKSISFKGGELEKGWDADEFSTNFHYEDLERTREKNDIFLIATRTPYFLKLKENVVDSTMRRIIIIVLTLSIILLIPINDFLLRRISFFNLSHTYKT